jgi:hypothetical protein
MQGAIERHLACTGEIAASEPQSRLTRPTVVRSELTPAPYNDAEGAAKQWKEFRATALS